MMTLVRAEIENMLGEMLNDDEGAMNTQFVLLAGVGAVIAIALGFILYQSVTSAGDSVDMDFEQIGN